MFFVASVLFAGVTGFYLLRKRTARKHSNTAR
jgi:hypothetical protein